MKSQAVKQARRADLYLSGKVKSVDKGTNSIMLVGSGPSILDPKKLSNVI